MRSRRGRPADHELERLPVQLRRLLARHGRRARGGRERARRAARRQVTLTGQSVAAALPDWLAEYGYSFGLLEAGYNEIPVNVWVAVRGSNTAERVQVQEVETVATTTITTAGGPVRRARRRSSTRSRRSPTRLDRERRDVEFRQGASGSCRRCPSAPTGPAHAAGSVYILARLGDAKLGLDCVPGLRRRRGRNASRSPPRRSPRWTSRVPVRERAPGGGQRGAGGPRVRARARACRPRIERQRLLVCPGGVVTGSERLPAPPVRRRAGSRSATTR